MKVIALYAPNGGVGKTTCAVNLAHIAAHEGYPALLWDLEPQGASSFYFRIKPKLKGGCEKLLRHKKDLGHYIKGSDFPLLDILPASFSCRNMDLLLENYRKPARHIKRLLAPLADQYFYVFLDCPSSSSFLMEAVLKAADAVVTPLPATPLSLQNLELLKEFMHKQKIAPQHLLPFLSMLNRSKLLHRKLETELRTEYPELLTTAIPYAEIVERMAAERLPLGVFAARGAVAGEYVKLWHEVKQRLGDDKRQ